MCGIAGLMLGKFKDAPEISRKLLFALQDRGHDAVGLSFFRNGEITVYKSQGRVKNFVKKQWDSIWREPISSAITLHCRAATSGAASNKVNNHPIFSKKFSVSLVHNGIINNGAELIKKYNLKKDGNCDSEIVLLMIEHFYKGDWAKAIKKAYKELSGSMACALLTRKDEVFLWRDSMMPLTVAYIPSLEGFMFASTKSILKLGISEIKTLFNYFVELKSPEVFYRELEENSMLRVTPGDITSYKLPKQKDSYFGMYSVPDYKSMNLEEYDYRQRKLNFGKFSDEAMKI